MLKVRRYLDWNFNMAEAPKDTAILLDVGMPWPVLGIWSPHYEAFVFPNLQVCRTQEPGDKEPWDDIYFENETEKTPRAFAIIPDTLPTKLQLDRYYSIVLKEGTYSSFVSFWNEVDIHLGDLNRGNFEKLGKLFETNFKHDNKKLKLKVEKIKANKYSVLIMCSTIQGSGNWRKLVEFYNKDSKTQLAFSGEWDKDNMATIVETLAEWLYYLIVKED